MSRRQSGFSLVETLVAMVIIVVGALALAATLAGGAAINARTTDRQKALALAEQQIDKLRSFGYDEIGMAPCSATGCPAVTSGAQVDPGRVQTDWNTYCPLPRGSVATNNPCSDYRTNTTDDKFKGRIITEAPQLNYTTIKNARDPRQAKQLQYGPTLSNNNSYQQNGMVAYTYVYWPYDDRAGRLRKDWKVATVVVRYRDAPGTTNADRNFGTVVMSTVIVDNPGLGQIPEVDTLACSDGLDNDGDGDTDADDAQCHTDSNPNNYGSYDSNGNSEN